MEQDITIRGIERRELMPGVTDGGMLALQGVERLGNAWSVTNKLKTTMTIPGGCVLVYVHTTATIQNYILFHQANSTLVYIKSGGASGIVAQNITAKPLAISHIGNNLCVATNDALLYFSYRNGQYENIKRTTIPILKFYQNSGIESIESDKVDVTPAVNLGFGTLVATSEDGYPHIFSHKTFIKQMTDLFVGQLANLRDKAAADNTLVDSYFIRYGFRMYDGNYLYVSPPILLNTDDVQYITNSAFYSAASQDLNWKLLQGTHTEAAGYKIYLDFSRLAIPTEMENGFIEALDIFMSSPIPQYDTDRQIDAVLENTLINETDKGDQYRRIVWGSQYQKSKEAHEKYINFYRVASYTLDDILSIKNNSNNPTHTSVLDISTQINIIEQLPLLENDTSIHNSVPQRLYSYNGRLHIYNVKDVLFNGFNFMSYIYDEAVNENGVVLKGDRYFDSFIITTIDIDNNKYEVKSNTPSNVFGVISGYISYPDARAKKMVLVAKASVDGVEYYYKRELILRPHSFRDEAYYFEGFDANIILVDDAYKITADQYNALKNKEYNDIEVLRDNIIKVSELNNPVIFDNSHTYMVGDSEITALATTSQAISTGQFGEYPLYVFTKNGIYAMSLGDGDVLYRNIVPFSRDKVLRHEMVLPIDRALIFGSSQGLFILRGGEIIDIGKALDRKGRLYILDQSNNFNLLNLLNTHLGVNISLPDLPYLIDKCKMIYDYTRNELFMYEPGNTNVYVYSLVYNMWSTVQWEEGIVTHTYDGKNTLLQSSEIHDELNPIYSIAQYNDSDAIADKVLFITQPMSFASLMTYKRVLRMRFLAQIKKKTLSNAPDAQLNVLIFGSNDGESFALIWQRTMSIVAMHDITAPHIGGAYRYYVVAIKGENLSHDSYIGNMLVDYAIQRYTR